MHILSNMAFHVVLDIAHSIPVELRVEISFRVIGLVEMLQHLAK